MLAAGPCGPAVFLGLQLGANRRRVSTPSPPPGPADPRSPPGVPPPSPADTGPASVAGLVPVTFEPIAVRSSPHVEAEGPAAAVLPDGPVRGTGPARALPLLQGMRVRQWPKNLLVFVAPAAARVLHHPGPALHALGACAAFTAAAAGTYLLNDVMDADADRRHPEKRRRPVAAGTLGARSAAVAGLVLLGAALASSWLLAGWKLFAVLAAYVGVSAAYTVRLKHEPVVELAAVASGFVLRAVAGGAATGVPLSSWFLVVTCFGALFVVVGKRAAEHRHLGEARGEHRPSLAMYSPSFLRSVLTLSAGVTVTAYCLWAFDRAGQLSHASRHLVWVQLTVVPVVLGLLHVLRLLDAGQGGAPEELVLRDRFLQAMGVLWVVLFAVGLYA